MPPTRRKPKSSTSTQPPLSFGPLPAKIKKPTLPPPSITKPTSLSKPSPSSKPSPPTADPSPHPLAATLSPPRAPDDPTLEAAAAAAAATAKATAIDEGTTRSQADGERELARDDKEATTGGGGKLAIREAPQGPRDEAEARAKRVKDVEVRRYWGGKEKERKAKRVHQNQLSLHEKILRHFDLSSQYGPCIGIARLARWKRAERLNLHPPIEVLAVLLTREEKERMNETEAEAEEKEKEKEKGGKGKGEGAYVDELLRGGGGE